MLSVCTLRTVVALTGALLAASTLAAPETSAVPAPAPLLAIAQTSQDGGTVEEGAPLTYRFTIENRGQAPLAITAMNPSCGCTATHFDPVIAPGTQGVIGAELKTRGFRGAVCKHLTVLSNDPFQPKLDLTLAATITPMVAIEPGPIALLAVGEKPVSQTFTLQRSGNRPMKLLEALPSHNAVTARVKPLPGVGRYQVTVTASPQVPLGRTSIPVRLRTDDAVVGDLTLHVIVDRGIVAMPRAVYIPVSGSAARAPTATQVTLVRQGAPFQVTGVASEDTRLATKVETIREGQEYVVTVTAPAGWAGSEGQTQIRVKTSDPTQPEVTLKVLAVIQQEE